MGKYKEGLYKKEEALLKHYDSNPDYGSVDVEKFFARFPEIDFDKRKVLDLGCGDGRFSTYLKEDLGARPFGVDFSKERIKKARANTRDINYFCMNCYEYIESYDTKKWGKFDYVLMTEVIEHLQNPQRLSKGLAKISNCIIGTVPLNFPYVAHLQVYKNEEEFKSQFKEWDLNTKVIGKNIYFLGRLKSK
jgi:2-polyprenyl-3-methyl-5-hydroxy-6-metoxy-1,4-benzoquinol methylase